MQGGAAIVVDAASGSMAAMAAADAALSSSGPGDAGVVDTAATTGADSSAGVGDAGARADDAATAGDAAPSDSSEAAAVAAALQGLFLDVPCAASTPTPLAQGATCTHPSGTQHIEKSLALGGQVGVTYALTLRIRAVWEPTLIQDGQRPESAHPLTVGGAPPAGMAASDPINYQQYSLQVSEPKQTYWLNDYQYVAHDIHKEDYQITIRAAGDARVLVIMNDGNDRQIANFTKASFSDLAPYDKVPSIGQWLRLDVVSVTRDAR
jgi:hypothetical protein